MDGFDFVGVEYCLTGTVEFSSEIETYLCLDVFDSFLGFTGVELGLALTVEFSFFFRLLCYYRSRTGFNFNCITSSRFVNITQNYFNYDKSKTKTKRKDEK